MKTQLISLLIAMLALLGAKALAEPSMDMPLQWQARWDTPTQPIVAGQRATVRLSIWLEGNPEQSLNAAIEVPTLEVVNFYYERDEFPNFVQLSTPTASVPGQQFRFEVFALTGPSITMPALSLDVAYQGQQYTVIVPATDIKVDPQAQQATGRFAMTQLKATQHFSQQSTVAGGVISRTITLSATDLPGYLIPEPYTGEENTHFTLQPGRVSSRTHYSRGQLSGEKTLQLHYRFDTSGAAEIPDLNVTWWDSKSSIERTTTIQGADIEVQPAPALPLRERIEVLWMQLASQLQALWRDYRFTLLGIALSACGIGWFMPLLGQWLRATISRLILATRQAYQRHFRLLICTLFGSPKRLESAFYKWGRQHGYLQLDELPSVIRSSIYPRPSGIKLKRYSLLIGCLQMAYSNFVKRFDLRPLN
ncbi:BatD family protein [Aliagarivorans marinus]|uniref:BatD family protein n=1 Tax=Aliagarivorans marinus TaxID=561965 RepID=UPI0004122166|nr:BatD family protein [Aliagarivorans marinus]